MEEEKRIAPYYVFLLLFPVSFLLHVVNENFGLLPGSVIIKQLALFLLITAVIASLSLLVLRNRTKAFCFAFLLLILYFLFGAFKDLLIGLPALNQYSLILPTMTAVVVITAFALKRSKKGFHRLLRLLALFLLINLVAEAGIFSFKIVTSADKKNDFGDRENQLIKNVQVSQSQHSPDIYWFIFDAYSASTTLQKFWNFKNPLDSQLRERGFFIADSATSNYNYTPYSITSTLDMSYLQDLGENSIVTARDMAKGSYAVRENNVVTLFEKLGYDIVNYGIYDFRGHATNSNEYFDYVPEALITHRTMYGRIRDDIGWNFRHLFASDREKADSLLRWNYMLELDKKNKALIANTKTLFKGKRRRPAFHILHFEIPHEPYIYTAKGEVSYKQGNEHKPEHYLEHLKYTNSVILELMDSLLAAKGSRNITILLQSDHGFKFEESDPGFTTDSRKILYALYRPDRNYTGWYRSISSVNGFRLLFNQNFGASFPLLPDTGYNLRYRKYN